MLAKGSGGEKYTLDTKKKHVYRTYTDYPVAGGMYVARIMDRGHRRGDVEAEVKDAVNSGSYYDDERPLNVLYTGGKFAGFLYEGDGSLTQEPQDDMSYESGYEGASVPSNRLSGGGSPGAVTLGIQAAVAVVMALVGYFAIYPILGNFMFRNYGSSIVSTLHYLDYNGIPAILVGIGVQAAVFFKFRDSLENPVIGGLIAAGVNLAGTVVWTVFVMLLMTIVMGAVAFIMKYIVIIVLIIGVYIWIKSKFSRRR